VLLFGGTDAIGDKLGDTWTWDGSTWTPQSPLNSPTARAGASMAYDPATNEVVLFGGVDGSGNTLNDTWVWNGTNWSQPSVGASPPPRHDATMAYDAAAGQIVLFGGDDPTGNPLSDTWLWNGTTWTQADIGSGPSARVQASMAYDAAPPGLSSGTTGQLVLFGGDDSSGSRLNDTWIWTWDSTTSTGTWTQAAPTTVPPGREAAAMEYDPAMTQLVLFGGDNKSLQDQNDTWTWNGINWIQQSPNNSPAIEHGGHMALDESNNTLVLFGGVSSTAVIGTTSTWGQDSSNPSGTNSQIVDGQVVYEGVLGECDAAEGGSGTYAAPCWLTNVNDTYRYPPATGSNDHGSYITVGDPGAHDV
jgi:hypothetical protein